MKPDVKTLSFVITFNLCLALNVSANVHNAIFSKVKQVEAQLTAKVGVAIYDVNTAQRWQYNGDSRFPLMSTFKTLACAKLLDDVNNGEQSFATTTTITADSLITWSPVTKHLVGEQVSLKQACAATMLQSDNTAANIVLNGIGGPKGLTQFLRELGDDVTRLDRVEPFLGEARKGDLRDTTTANAMVNTLNTLLFTDRLSLSSRNQLKQWMMANQVSDNLLRSVLPNAWFIADRSGAGGFGSRGITAVVWSDQQTPLIIVIYITQTEATFAQRDLAITQIGHEIFQLYDSPI